VLSLRKISGGGGGGLMKKDYTLKTKVAKQHTGEKDLLARSYIKALLKKIKPSNIASLSGISLRSILKLSSGLMACGIWHFNKIQKLYNQFYN